MTGAEPTDNKRSMTIPEYAALCRERCTQPAQGFDDGRACGSTSHDPDEGETFHFCGFHWAPVIGNA